MVIDWTLSIRILNLVLNLVTILIGIWIVQRAESLYKHSILYLIALTLSIAAVNTIGIIKIYNQSSDWEFFGIIGNFLMTIFLLLSILAAKKMILVIDGHFKNKK